MVELAEPVEIGELKTGTESLDGEELDSSELLELVPDDEPDSSTLLDDDDELDSAELLELGILDMISLLLLSLSNDELSSSKSLEETLVDDIAIELLDDGSSPQEAANQRILNHMKIFCDQLMIRNSQSSKIPLETTRWNNLPSLSKPVTRILKLPLGIPNLLVV